MKFNRSLVLLILAGLLPMAVLAAAMGASALRQQQDAMQRDALARVNLVSSVLERDLNAQIDLVRALAVSPVLTGPTPDLKAFTAEADAVRRTQPLWSSVVLSDAEGNRLVVSTDLTVRGGGKVAQPDSHAAVVRTGKPAIGAVRRPSAPGTAPRAGIGVSFPIRAPVIRDGKVAYVVTAILQPRAVRAVLFKVGLPPRWLAAVVDDHDNFVARTAGAESLLGNPASAYVKAANARARVGKVEGVYEGVTLEGIKNVTAYRMLPGLGWSVHLAIPWDMYQAPIRKSLLLLTATSAASLAMAGMFAWLLWRELSLRRREEAALEEIRRMEALGRMTGGVAHDFNNLLMIVQGSAELLKRRKDDPVRIEAFTDAILTAAQRGQALTRQLLAFARRSSHEPVAFVLQERAAEIQGLLDRATRGDIETVVTAPRDVWPMRADVNALEIALINLAVNARDAMPKGGRIHVGAANVAFRQRDKQTGLTGDFVALSVRDTGAGIEAEHLGRIFEPFYTTKPAGKGTGLGLSQVYGFANQSGGAVTVTSRPGVGSTFTLYLPRSDQPGPAPAGAAPLRETPDQGRLLLVEDNQYVAEVAKEMLAAAGYDVTRTSSAEEALAALDGGARFDLALSDVVLENGMSGLDLAQELRRRLPDLPVVLMTGYSEALATGDGHGFTVLAKPFGQSEITAALRAARNAVGPKAAE